MDEPLWRLWLLLARVIGQCREELKRDGEISGRLIDSLQAQGVLSAPRLRWVMTGARPSSGLHAGRNRINTVRVAPVDGMLQIDIEHRDGATVLAVDGEIDLATAPMLDERITTAFEAGSDETVIIDLDRVSFMDSSGLQVLLSHIFSQQNGRRIRITKGSPQVYRLFEVSGMADKLPFTSED
jgi:anti-anti-sigma factor